MKYRYRIQAGDSISNLAWLVHKPETRLRELNNLKGRRKGLKPGQLLCLPVPLTFYMAEKNDTIRSVADRYGIDFAKLIKANQIQTGQGLVPGKALLLPQYQGRLKGQIWYLNEQPGQVELKALNLANMHSRVLYRFNKGELPLGRPNPETYRISTFDPWPAVCSLLPDKLDDPSLSLASRPYTTSDSEIKESGYPGSNLDLQPCGLLPIIKSELKEHFGENSLSHYRFSPDQTHLLLFVILPSARETAAFLYHLPSSQLHQISENGVDGVFSSDSQHFLLLEKDSYGACYPWFYQQIKLYSSRGYCRGEVIKGRSLQIDENCFNQDNTALIFIMHTPRTFYPLPEYHRNLYIKPLESPLLFQLTDNERPLSPRWL